MLENIVRSVCVNLLFCFSRKLEIFLRQICKGESLNLPTRKKGEYRFPTDDLIIGIQPAGRLS